jgi:hypothetical protein
LAEAETSPGTVVQNVSAANRDETPPLPRWAQRLTWLLDDVVQSPGGKFGIGADGVIGLLLPGAGDAITGLGSAALLLLALREGVPTVMVGRMLLNIALDLVVGAIPIVGDIFDIVWRSNRRNYEIIEKYRSPNADPTALDYLLVVGGLLLALLIMATPFILWLFWATVLAFLVQMVFGGAG